jgi:sterol desaturase/sphingolipid hydroxylase (fatty acid hydroxylase superfamily)
VHFSVNVVTIWLPVTFFTEWFGARYIPVRGKHLDELSPKHILFIGFSKANTAPFTYFYFRYAFHAPNVIWAFDSLTLLNTAVALAALFIVFDFTYTLLHWFLHIKGVYGYIHKHHHHQKAPSRAAVDAINVHPVEYLLGEYNHLSTLFCVNTFLVDVHVLTAVAFLVIGGMLAALNHTRYDLVVSLWPGFNIYDTKAHDVHHRIPQSNYGQYTMFWDWVFGSYRYVFHLCSMRVCVMLGC